MKALSFLLAGLCILCAVPHDAKAHADTITVTVRALSEIDGDQCMISFVPQREGGPTRVRKEPELVRVHIRYKPRNLALPVSKTEHAEALRYLKRMATPSVEFKIMRMSSRGYLPIRGRKGHFRCDAVKLVEYGGRPQTILFVHSDDDDVSRD